MAGISPLIPKNGAVVLGTMISNYASFDLSSSQNVENITGYSNSNMTQSYGDGTQDFSINVTAFALAHQANTAPGMVDYAPYGGATGANTTLTADTGCSWAGVAVVSSVRIAHARMRAAVLISFTAKNGYAGLGAASDWVQVWASS